jgi:Fe-S-cluster containining protein
MTFSVVYFPFFLHPFPMPPTYLCQRCTACCRWPGFVHVSEQEIKSIATFVKVGEASFIENYTRLRPNRQGLALVDQPDGACIFLKGKECTIQAVKPQQCKDFPNGWNFPGWREVCEAIEIPVRDEA